MLWKRLRRRYTNKVENPYKVDARLKQLNKGLSNKPWVAIPGFNVMTGITFTPQGPYFNSTSGYPVKVFVNIVTGEVKTYSAEFFK